MPIDDFAGKRRYHVYMSNSCKICGEETQIINDRKFKQNYYFCRVCLFISLEEAKTPSPEEEKEDYLTHDNSFKCQGYVNMHKEFIEKAVAPFISPPADVLDFGCGHGPVLAHLLKENGFQVDAYDIYFAPEKVFENKSYDLITSTEVVEHLKDPLRELKLLKKLLKPGGFLAVMTLFHPDDEKEFLEWYYKREISHIAFYTPKTMRKIADILGFRIVHLDDRNLCVFQSEIENHVKQS